MSPSPTPDTALQATADPLATHVRGRSFHMLIDGEPVDALSGATAPTIDPSTGLHLAEVPDAGPQDVRLAVAAAERAQPAWAALSLAQRARSFARFAELLDEHAEELAMLDAIDSGNPVRAMREDVRLCRVYLDGWPAMAAAIRGEVIPASPGNLHYTSYRPYGVVGRITAFNHPLMFAVTRPLPALITGNTVVLKPSPQAPLSTLRLGELFAEAFPPGVVNIVSGGAEPGDALVTHPTVKRIAFTGSVGTGLKIQRRAAESGHVKHLSLELGGKNAMIVFPDVDLDAAVEGAVFGMNFNVCQGQSCGSNSRVLVHRSVYDGFVNATARALEAFEVTTAYSERADMGPVVDRAQYERVLGFVGRGVDEGASLVTGGARPPSAPDCGWFIAPTLFADVRPGQQLAQEEIFGPVMSVMPWDDYDDMLTVANGTSLGLTASVWTHDLHLAHKTADALDAGYVWINDSTRHYFGTPFGGTRDSGLGREESAEELLTYCEQKVVHTRFETPSAALRRHGW
ncbi:aldehyde dehydrogenase family protein [Streptomyces puniciscabiei]